MAIVLGTLLIVGAVLILGGICRGLLWMEQRAPMDDYDERQKQARGSAYRISFWLGVVYNLVVVTLATFDLAAEELHTVVMMGILLQIMAFHICCMVSHADLPLSGNPWGVIAVDLLLGVKNIVELYLRGISMDMGLHELSRGAWIDLICGVFFMLLAVIQLIQLRRDGREE